MERSNIFSSEQIETLKLLEELRVTGGYKTREEALDALIKQRENK